MTSLSERPSTTSRKRSILDAALACFSERGVEGTTIQDIQAAAGCSVGSLYHHFGSKEGVAEALWLDAIARFNAAMIRKIETAASGEEAVRGVVTTYCAWTARHARLARFLHSRDIEFSEDAKARQRALHQAYIGRVFELFAPFVRAGEVAELPLHAYVPLISGPIEAYVRRWLGGDAPSPTRVQELFADAAWNAVKGPAVPH